MGYEITGVSSPFGGLQWQKTEGDRGIARRVLNFLEDRRLLFADRHVEDEEHCVESALQIRTFLTEQVNQAKPGKDLEVSLLSMRAACRRFVQSGGPTGRGFARAYGPYEADGFGLALGDLRTTIGHHLAVILSQYDLPIESELARILPASEDDGQDLGWFPGFRTSDDSN